MEVNFNSGSLKIIEKPLNDRIEELKGLVVLNLEALSSGGDTKSAGDLFLKLQNSFLMIDLYGVVEFLSLNQRAFDLATESDDPKGVYQDIISNLDQIKTYISGLLGGKLDNPTFFYVSYKGLADKVGINVNVSNLISPRLDVLNSALGLEVIKGLRIGRVFKKEEDLYAFKEKVGSKIHDVKESISKMSHFLDLTLDGSLDGSNKADYYELCKLAYESLFELQKLKISKSYYSALGLSSFLIYLLTPSEKNEELIKNSFYDIEESLDAIVQIVDILNEKVSGLSLNSRTGSYSVPEKVGKVLVLNIAKALNAYPEFKDSNAYLELCSYFNVDFYAQQLKNISVPITPERAFNVKDAAKALQQLNESVLIVTSKVVPKRSFDHVSADLSRKLRKTKEFVSNNGFLVDYIDTLESYNKKMQEFIDDDDLDEFKKREFAFGVILLNYAFYSLNEAWVDDSEIMQEMSLSKERMNRIINGESELDLPLPNVDEKSKLKEEVYNLKKVYGELSSLLKKTESIFDEYMRYGEISLGDPVSVGVRELLKISRTLELLMNYELSIIAHKAYELWDGVDSGQVNAESAELKQSIGWLSGMDLFFEAQKEGNEESSIIEKRVIDNYLDFYELPSIDVGDMLIKPKESKEQKVSNQNTKEVANEIKESVVLHSDSGNGDGISEIQQCFFDELVEIQDDFFGAIRKLKANNSDLDALLTVRRSFHTIKGSGRMVGFNSVGELAWEVESFLNKEIDRIQSEEQDGLSSPKIIDAVQVVVDTIYQWRVDVESEGHVLDFDENSHINKFNSIINGDGHDLGEELDVSSIEVSSDDTSVAEDEFVAADLSGEAINQNDSVRLDEYWSKLVHSARKLEVAFKLKDVALLAEFSNLVSQAEVFAENENSLLVLNELKGFAIKGLINVSQIVQFSESNVSSLIKSVGDINISSASLDDVNDLRDKINDIWLSVYFADTSSQANDKLEVASYEAHESFLSAEDVATMLEEAAEKLNLKVRVDMNDLFDKHVSSINDELNRIVVAVSQKINNESQNSEVNSVDHEKIYESIKNEMDKSGNTINEKLDNLLEAQKSLRELYKAGVNKMRGEFLNSVKKKQNSESLITSITNSIKGLFRRKS